jgi:hypothetical protein
MQVRTIPKNYGTHISSPLGRATNNKDIVLKSQG